MEVIMEPVSINPEVLAPHITISLSFALPTNLSTKIDLVSVDLLGPFTEFALTSPVCPTTGEVTRLNNCWLHWSCYHGEHHGRWYHD